MKEYGKEALEGNSKFFALLDKQRKVWRKKYALDVLASQTRPKAHEAFRQRDYAKAADLYSQIKECLTPTEVRKLNLAKKRRFL